MKKQHTPVELEVLLGAFYMGSFIPHNTQAVKKAVEKWLRLEMIVAEKGGSFVNYKTTTKGDYFVNHLCSIPVPKSQMRFHIPKE